MQKQSTNINFFQGVDTKSDPNQVEFGKLLRVRNSVFNKLGELKKRNGFGLLPSLPDTTATFATTHNDNLIVLGNNLQVLSSDTRQWLTKGFFQDVDMSVSTLVRTTTSQQTVDSAIARNMAVCTVYKDSNGSNYYAVSDSGTGEIIVASTVLPATSTNPRVCFLGTYFIITYLVTVSAVTHLEYIAIPSFNPQNPGARTTLASDVHDLNSGYDIVVANNNMYFSYWSNAGGNAVRSSFIDSTLLLHVFTTIAGFAAHLVTLSVDITTPTPNVYLTFYQQSNFTVYGVVYDANLNLIIGPVVTYVASAKNQVVRLTSSAQFQLNTIFYEITDQYPNNTNVGAHFVIKNTIDVFGTTTGSVIIDLGVGLSSKSFIINEKLYVLFCYNGVYQPTYFLSDEFGNIIAKLAYSNGAGYCINQILPQGNVVDNVVQIGYLLKDLIAPVNKSLTADSINGIYSQTGINIAAFELNSGKISTNEISGSLMITGGFPWMYDGYKPVEHNFFLYPEDIAFLSAGTGGGLKQQQYFYAVTYEWTDAAGNIHRSAPSVPVNIATASISGTPVTFTAAFLSGDTAFTASSVTGLFVGQVLTDATTGGNFQPDTVITAINGPNITINLPTLGNSAGGPGDTIQTVDTFANTLYIPTDRLTYKISPSDVRIVIYRWSTDQQIFYQITSIPSPVLNDKSSNDITYVDTKNDASIIGNFILYTTGGVLENTQAPACSVSTLFNSRYFIVDSEDKNLIWDSKPVIEQTPVETSQYQTLYVAPTSGAQGYTGPITALASMDDKLIIFKKNAIYYITGKGPDIAGGNNDFSDATFITSSVGCDNQNSLVIVPNGLMFQSDKGIWLLARDLSTQYIGADVAEFNGIPVVSALIIPGSNEVRFTLEGQNPTLMYDYYVQQWGEFDSISAVSSATYRGLQTFINKYGEVYQETPGIYLDAARPVLMGFTTSWAKFAGLQGYQRAYYFYLLATYYSPHLLSLTIAYDYNPYAVQQVLIHPTNFSGFYGDDPIYGNGSPYGGEGSSEKWKIHLQTQKCESMQITLQEIFDPTLGAPAGAGFTLSGINLVYGMKKGWAPLRGANTAG